MVVSLVYYSDVLVTLVLQFCCTFKASALDVQSLVNSRTLFTRPRPRT